MENDRSRLRVCFVYHFLPDYREGVFQELLNDPTLDVEFIAGKKGGEFTLVPEAKSIPFHHVDNWWRGNLLWQKGLFKKLSAEKYDVVVFRGSWCTISTWLGAIYTRLTGSTVLFWMIGWRKHEKGWRRLIRTRYMRLAHGLLLYGDRSKKIGVTTGYPESRMCVIGNSIPVPDRDIEMIVKPENTELVLWITRIIPYKRGDLLLQAIGLVHERGHKVKCVFVGSSNSEELEKLQLMAQELDIVEYIRFEGRIDDREMQAWCDQAGAVAIPNWAGLTVASSIVNGVPVIVNDDPEANPPEWEFVHPIQNITNHKMPANGSLYKIGDAASLADEIVRWCVTSPATSEERRDIATAGRWIVSPSRSATAIVDACHHYHGDRVTL